MSVSVSTTAGNQVSVTIDGQTLLSFTTEESSVNVLNGGTTSVTVTEKGAKGDTGATGATGATGPAGADGQGVPAGGAEGQVLVKSSATDYDTAWDYVESTYLQVENAETTSIPAGTVVYAFGISGSNITVKKADASNSSTMPAIGVVLEEIASGSAGEIITSGLFNKTISGLSGINVGDTVYVSETAGGITTTKPTGTALIQNIGVVLKTNGSNIQKMKVSAIDRVNDIPNIPNGQAWIGNASGVPTPTTLATVATTGAYSDISGTPSLATVATTGAYSDLSGTPTIPSSGVDFDPVGTDNSTDVTLSGSYDYLTLSGQQITLGQVDYSTDISNKPSLLDASGTPANNQLAVWVDADTLEGDASLTWTGTLLTVVGTAVVDRINIDESSISSAGQYGAGSRVLDRIGSNTLSITAGDLYYLGSASWSQADADAASTASGLLAIATATTSNNGMLVSGVVKVADNAGFSSASEGDVLYVSTTAGHVTTTAPTATGDIVRVVGYVLDPTNGIIYFDPSKDWIELS
jgi:predicted RecA/RadA family phage recombinase